MAATRRILSGIQPTGIPHLGNYLGALVNWSHGEVLYSVVDLHAMTVPYDASSLRRQCRDTVATLLACGVDPAVSRIFQQSQVKEHTELAWILGCHTPLGWLRRMTQFKQKGKKQDLAPLGLLSYPVLMAADILIYRATTVPVGDDQKQHLELTRDMAISFNSKYGDVFPVPDGIFPSGGETRVMSLRNASNKMSKSDKSDATRINLDDDADAILKKLRKAKSDSIEGITYDPEERPELANLLHIFAGVTGGSAEAIAAERADQSMRAFKEELADAVIARIVPIASKIREYQDDQAYLDTVITEGHAAAQAVATRTMDDVKRAIGLPPSL